MSASNYAAVEQALREGMRTCAEQLDMIAARADLVRPAIVGSEEERDRCDALITSVRTRASRLRRASRKVGRHVRRVSAPEQQLGTATWSADKIREGLERAFGSQKSPDRC